ncbi:MAG TPA: GTPase domain-containing protein [Acidimicrobiia bacterium]|nr:GTPase domain-containing protein [Acidimicrobiia bacterium]
MDYRPAQRLAALLSEIDQFVAAPAMRPLERLLDRSTASESLIVTLVGPSGVGKSEIVNRLAGERLVTAGPLRPTTTSVAVWGEIDTDYLPGGRVSGPDTPVGIALVDTPPIEHFADTVTDVLDRTDVAMLVVSPERYADVVTAEALAFVRERGVPLCVVFFGELDLATDAASKLGVAIDAVVYENVDALRTVLSSMAEAREGLVDMRDRAAAIFVAARTGDVAQDFADRTGEAQRVAAAAADTFKRFTVDRRRLGSVADRDWDAAAPEVVEAVRASTDAAIDELAVQAEGDGVSEAMVSGADAVFVATERAPIEAWHDRVTEDAILSVKHRHLHPFRLRSVRDEMWRLGIDFERRPPKRVRKALGALLPDLRIASAGALDEAMRAASSNRVSAFVAALDPYANVSPADLRDAAEDLAAAARGSTWEAGVDE